MSDLRAKAQVRHTEKSIAEWRQVLGAIESEIGGVARAIGSGEDGAAHYLFGAVAEIQSAKRSLDKAIGELTANPAEKRKTPKSSTHRGEKVRHAGGGPEMTVLRVAWSHCGAIVRCFWKYEDGRRGWDWFPIRDLVSLATQGAAS